MAQAIITRRDYRYTGVGLERPIITPAYRIASRELKGINSNTIVKDTVYYPLGDETTVSTKDGYIYLCFTNGYGGDTSVVSYTLTIGDQTFTERSDNPISSPTGSENRIRLQAVYYIPKGVTVSYSFNVISGSLRYWSISAACSAE